MGEFSAFGRVLMLMGLVLVLIGALLVFAGKIPGIGRLPGDIYVRRGNFSFYFPLATCIIISLILSLLFGILGRR